MKEKKEIDSAPKALGSDRFMETLRKTLEHITDPDWLAKNSPLASVFFAGTTVSTARQRQVTLSGRPEIDLRLRAIWHEWESLQKTPLQSLVWETVCQLPADIEMPLQATLMLTYFDIDLPKQSQVIKLLAIGRSTYYRYLEKAVGQLGNLMTRFLRPSLRLERPTPRPLIGRDRENEQAQAQLDAGEVVHLVGGSGLGKTMLGAQLADQWPHAVFWYTFRSGLTDYLDQFLYSVAYFLLEQGQSGLWLYLAASREPVRAGRAILALRQHLAELHETPPLFCIDEVDLLLADDLHDSEEHAMLRSLLEEWSQADRQGSPLLLIGQRLLLNPDGSGLHHLQPLTATNLSALMRDTKTDFTPEQTERLVTLTRGNPLLIRLFLTLCQRTSSLLDAADQLTTSMTLDWFLARLSKHLKTKEQVVLYELSVFDHSAPIDAWVRTRKELDSLIELGLIQPLNQNSVSLHPALRKLIYEQLSAERRSELHLAAGHILAERSRFTAAARHYIAGEQPELAIWTWYNHADEETEQGQANAALELFSTVDRSALSRTEDQQALALLLGPLMARSGLYRAGLSNLDQPNWREDSTSAVLAHETRGELYAEVGEVDRSIAEFRKGLNSLERIRTTHEAELRLKIALRSFTYLHDIEQASEEIEAADLLLRILRGNIERAKGDYGAAQRYYREALEVAQQCNSLPRLAMLHASLGNLAAQQGDLDAAVAHYDHAGQHFEATGNVVAANGSTNSGLAFAYLLHHRYADAVAPAEKALNFFQEIGHAYWISINETYLAEAWLYLDDLEKSEAYVQSALSQEEITVRPYCLFLLGHVRRRQERFAEAERCCLEAIEVAAEFEDPNALGPAWRALGETLRDADRIDEAHAAFHKALTFWQQVDNHLEIDCIDLMLQELADREGVER